MAGTIRYLSKINLSLLSNNITRQIIFNGSRTLYSESSLGLPEYKATRDVFYDKYQSGIEAFRKKLQDAISNDQEMIFTEDMKAILHLAEKSPEDIDIIKKLLVKYNSQSSALRFSSFRFGPVVMRTLYHLNQPDLAKELFLNPDFNTFFDQISSFMVLLDLLYENQKYADVREVYEKIRTRPTTGSSHPKLVINIVGASLYKENTPESLEYGLTICRNLNEKGSVPLRKFIAMLGALALNQQKPHIALELLAQCRAMDYVSVRSIKIMALADMDKIDDIIIHFNTSLRRIIPNRNSYYPDAIDRVNAAMERLNIGEDAKIRELVQLLQDRGYIYQMRMDEHFTQPLDSFKRIENSTRYENQGLSSTSRPRFLQEKKDNRGNYNVNRYDSVY